MAELTPDQHVAVSAALSNSGVDVAPQQVEAVHAAVTSATAVNWWASRTMWAAVVTVLASGLALAGHTIPPEQQSQLTNGLADLANGLSVVAGLAAAYYRSRTSVGIKSQIIPPALGGKKT
jgi:hypothetical protein